jgi:hypothetical protein
MKIALVFSGQPRFVNSKAYLSIHDNLLQKYNCDIYAHFWFSSNINTKYETAPWSSLGDIQLSEYAIKDFIELYHPIKIEFEEPYSDSQLVERTYTRVNHPREPYNTRSMFISHKKAYSLVINPEQYDFIIRIRTDDYIYTLPDLNIISKDKNYVFLQDETRGIINDSFAIIRPSDAKYIFNGIDIIDTLYDNGTKFNNEDLFRAILEYYDVFKDTELLKNDTMKLGFFRGNRIQIWKE